MDNNSEQELISVLLPIYKEPLDWIQKSVYSIIEQTYKCLDIVIIIDNPDRNDVLEWLKKIDEPRIRYYSNEKNIGLVKTLNKGINLCKGEYIARMDADDISLPDRIFKQYLFMRKNKYHLVGGIVESFNEKGVFSIGRLPGSYEKMQKFIKNGGTIPHPTWLIKKSMYMELGLYREIKYAEDYDFLIRSIIKGYKIGAVKDICLKYRQNLAGITQHNKGCQKYITKLLKEQGINNEIYELDYLQAKLSCGTEQIALYQDYYRCTRMVRNAIDSKKMKLFFACIGSFKLGYLKILFGDIVQKILNKFYCM